jgi:transcriptional regulator with XRE-family HTH domain
MKKREKLAAARYNKGWSQEQLAEKIGVTRNTVSAWERGMIDPYPVHVQHLCNVFALSVEDLDLVSDDKKATANSVSLQESYVVSTHLSLSGFEMLMKSRRQVLQDILNVACVAVTLSPYELLPRESRVRLELAKDRSSYLDDEALDDLEAITARYWRLCQNTSIDILSGLSGHFSNVVQFLKDSHPVAIYEKLCSLASENALILGKTFHEMKEYDLAWSYYKFALKVALDTQNKDLWAASVGRVALLQIYWGEPRQALPMLQEAQRVPLQSQRIRPWLSAIEAEIHAGMGHEDACLRSLEKTKNVTLPAPLDDNFFVTSFDASRAAGYEGACFVRLRKPELALPALEQALTLFDPTSLRRKSTLIADIGTVHAQLGNPEEACRLLSRALDMTMQTKSLVVVQRVCKARNELKRWKQSADVKSLDVQIADTFTALTKLKEETKM